jgi:hypothetical protein
MTTTFEARITDDGVEVLRDVATVEPMRRLPTGLGVYEVQAHAYDEALRAWETTFAEHRLDDDRRDRFVDTYVLSALAADVLTLESRATALERLLGDARATAQSLGELLDRIEARADALGVPL